MKRGFTLVELSIVLVIIGLLIGGILVGQSLVDSAKTNRIISEVEQHMASTRLFIDRYKGLPGDHRRARELFGTTTYNGDGSGVLCRDEVPLFWQHMYLGGFIEESMSGTSSDADCVGNWNMSFGVRSYPSGAAGGEFGDSSGPAYMVRNSNPYRHGEDRLTFHLARFTTGPQSNNVGYGQFTPIEMQAIDAKADDGVPDTGDIYGVAGNDNLGGGANYCASHYAWAGSAPGGPVTYTLDNPDILCLAVFATGY